MLVNPLQWLSRLWSTMKKCPFQFMNLEMGPGWQWIRIWLPSVIQVHFRNPNAGKTINSFLIARLKHHTDSNCIEALHVSLTRIPTVGLLTPNWLTLKLVAVGVTDLQRVWPNGSKQLGELSGWCDSAITPEMLWSLLVISSIPHPNVWQ